MNIRTKIILGFCLIILLLSTTGFLLIKSMQSLAKEAENIYKHPFAVSNATRELKINIFAIQNDLNLIMMTTSHETFGILQERIRGYEREALEQIKLIEERFLGSQEDVEKVKAVFLSWLGEGHRLIETKRKGAIKENSLLNNPKSNVSLEQLEKEIKYLSDFASRKADEFYGKTLTGKRYSLFSLSLLLTLTIAASCFILLYVVRKNDQALKERNRHFHLIDQNILTASVNINQYFTNVSSALCRFLDVRKTEILKQKCKFFITDPNQERLVSRIYDIIGTGSEWRGEITRTREDNETQWIQLHIHPEFDENFNLSSYNLIIQDITDKKALENLSLTDKLTGLHNRRYFDDIIKKEIKMAQRKDIYLTLAILDIDRFKNYNDQYGHPAGDEVLESISGIIKKRLNRPNDYSFRLGGEEFGILFSDTDKDGSFQFLEKIRMEVEQLKIKHEFSDISEYVTVSIGAKVAKGFSIPPTKQYYIQADQALYQAKKHRNKVIISKKNIDEATGSI